MCVFNKHAGLGYDVGKRMIVRISCVQVSRIIIAPYNVQDEFMRSLDTTEYPKEKIRMPKAYTGESRYISLKFIFYSLKYIKLSINLPSTNNFF